MRRLRLVALSDDGTSLVLALDDPDGGESERVELPVDDRLRAAARGDARRLGQIDVGSQLSPRAIQARIRSGHTPEQVAEDSGTPVERIMRFAHPVLQERSRIADQAREARVRLSEGTLTVNLHQFMSERVRMIGSESADVAFDAHRADDGAWLVTAAWQTGPKSGTAIWTFDLAGRTVAPADAATMDFAEGTRLVRVVPDVPNPPAEPAVQAPAAALHDTADAPPDPDDDGGAPAPTPAPAPAQEPARPAPTATGIDTSYLDEVAEHDTVVLGRTPEDDDDPRVRIPAWEDIVFGVRRHR
jgi:hypothetical protein